MTGPLFDGRCEYHRRAMLLGANPREHRTSGLPQC
jgi:hypothetical protein